MPDGEEPQFTEGAASVVTRWWRRLSTARRVLIVVFAAFVVGYLVVGILAVDGIVSGWFNVYGLIGYPVIAVVGGFVNRRERDRELDAIAERAALEEADENDRS